MTFIDNKNWELIINNKYLKAQDWEGFEISEAPEKIVNVNLDIATCSVPRDYLHRQCTILGVLRGSETFKLLMDLSLYSILPEMYIHALSTLNSDALNLGYPSDRFHARLVMVQSYTQAAPFFDRNGNLQQSKVNFKMDVIETSDSGF